MGTHGAAGRPDRAWLMPAVTSTTNAADSVGWLRRCADRVPPPGHRELPQRLTTPLAKTTFVVLDLETTGLSPEHDRITEIGAVKIRGRQVLREVRTFVDPGRSIPPSISALTGITDAMVHGAPSIASILDPLIAFLDGAVLVAHHARFDLAFLQAAASSTGHGRLQPPTVDTVMLARRLLDGELATFDLATVARHLHTLARPAHRALADARTTVDVLHGLIERAARWEATTLGALCQLATPPSIDRRAEG